MNLRPAVMENAFVRLEPLAETHREELRAACDADPALWRNLYSISWTGDQFDSTWARMTALPATVVFAVLVEGRCQGMTGYLGIDHVNGAVEVGGTYYAPGFRGGPTNPAAKLLMLGHAFESGARRLSFRVDALNLRSRAAVLKLGAVQEGILRQEKVVWTGRVRDTVVFSVLSDEWPAVKAGLEARLR